MTTGEAVNACETILHEERAYDVEAEILKSEVAVIDRLLARRIEIEDAYVELCAKLGEAPHAAKCFLGVLLSTAAFWSPDEIEKVRLGRDRLRKVNSLIADKAAELAQLLDERTVLHNESGYPDTSYYGVAQAIDAAGNGNTLFRMYVRPGLKGLRREFGLKYWPSIADCIASIGQDAAEVDLEATDPITAAATIGSRASLADFFKALFEAVPENSVGEGGFIPDDLKLTDNCWASMANCALDLGPEALVDGPYVKRLRQRIREQGE